MGSRGFDVRAYDTERQTSFTGGEASWYVAHSIFYASLRSVEHVLIVCAARQTSAPKIEAPVPRSARPRAAAVGNLLDPRLTEQQLIKLESAITPTSTPQSGPVLRQRPPRAFGVHMQYWPGTESRKFK